MSSSKSASESQSWTTTSTSLFRSRTGQCWMRGRPSPYSTTISRTRRRRRALAAIRHRLRDAGAHADDAAVIERLPKLRLIASTAIRNASIDLKAAEERGVQVVHTGYTRRRRSN